MDTDEEAEDVDDDDAIANLIRKDNSADHNRLLWVLVIAVLICQHLGHDHNCDDDDDEEEEEQDGGDDYDYDDDLDGNDNYGVDGDDYGDNRL